jgi:crossover junction endodeoxyribonuclease RusA
MRWLFTAHYRHGHDQAGGCRFPTFARPACLGGPPSIPMCYRCMRRMLPFEFTVLGPPLSHQSRNKQRLAAWRASVLAAARARWPSSHEPLDQPLKVIVVYYHDHSAVSIDNDNLVKPIQDALNGYVYVDDALIVDTVIRKTALDGSFKVRRMSRMLADAFVEGDEFLHIRIEAAPSHEVLI